MGGKRVEYSVPELHRLWAGGASYAEIAAALGCAETFVQRLKVRHRLPDRERRAYVGPSSDPAPDEIERMKAAIKARHIHALQGESDEQTRTRVWKENQRRGIRTEVA